MPMCKVVKAESRLTDMGSEVWTLTLACGVQVKRTKRRRNTRKVYPAPSRVKHEHPEPSDP